MLDELDCSIDKICDVIEFHLLEIEFNMTAYEEIVKEKILCHDMA